jgi:hypothetical protein
MDPNEVIADNLYEVGSVVTARNNPTVRLVVRRYLKRVYYCIVQDHPDQKERVYFERELSAS